MATKFQGSQSFQRQVGDSVQFNSDGTATHTVTWRGPLHRLNAFRGTVPTSSPDFPTLKISRPPNEVYEGAYVRVTAIYGGTSDEISANYPNDIDNDTPDIPTVTLSADFQQTSVVLNIDAGDAGNAQFEVTYRQPINTVTYTENSKPASVSKKSRSGIESEADPKILQVSQLTDWSTTGFFTDFFGDGETPFDLIATKYADQWEIKTIAIGFSRHSNGQFWRVSETWTKGIFQVQKVEGD